jgi:hypothetical protein
MVVYQCIQAVDLFGLEVEGIYRIPGTSSHIQQMKALFDSGMYRPQVYLDRANINSIQMLHRSISEIQRLSNMTSIALPDC